ncbi:MAG: hypothetical protein DCC71_23605 [Proteobacteria bacterium]|nr:MAG: hypothetical protein DCC71_23605 [Pseudomonadota bacterium]
MEYPERMAKKTLNLGGRQVQGDVVRFKVVEEPWCEYDLEDGTKVRLKIVVSEVIRLEGVYTDEGDPVYTVKSSNVMSTEVPDNLRKAPGTAKGPGSNPGHYV